MRIFYASGRTPNGAVAGSEIWRKNLYGALVSLGHDVVEFDYDLEPLLAAADITVPANREFVERWRPHAEGALLDQVKQAEEEEHVDLFFSYFYSSCCTAETILKIRSMGIKTMNWYCNASYQLHLVADLAPAYDWCLVPEKYRIEDYKALGANPVYFQEAANPDVYYPRSVSRDLDVTFVGACYRDRPRYIKALADVGIDVRAFGPGWRDPALVKQVESPADLLRIVRHPGTLKRLAARAYRRAFAPERVQPVLPRAVCGPVLSDEEMVEMYSRSRISLGFAAVDSGADGRPIKQIRLRDFEAPMSGAFYMTEYQEEIEEFFEIGKEIVCFTDPDDLVEKCRYYLAHPDEREAIRLAGLERARRDHTWQKRFSDLFADLGLGDESR
jgi:spore maturation protein CgeB